MAENNTTVLAENTSIKTVHRKKTRKYLFQKLYARTFNNIQDDLFKESFYDWVLDFDVDSDYLDSMFELIISNEKQLNSIIWLLAPKFRIQTMNLAYVLPMYIGITEMLFLDEEIPAKVSINEAVEMAKVYWDDSSKKIVNGVMNKLYKDFSNISTQIDRWLTISEVSIFPKV